MRKPGLGTILILAMPAMPLCRGPVIIHPSYNNGLSAALVTFAVGYKNAASVSDPLATVDFPKALLKSRDI